MVAVGGQLAAVVVRHGPSRRLAAPAAGATARPERSSLGTRRLPPGGQRLPPLRRGHGLGQLEFAEYDLGQSVAHMTLQAMSMGLFSRQFRAFDREAVERELGVPEHWVAMTVTAIGRPAQEPPPEGRMRRPLDDVWWR